ncbi:alpha,alpha-trehalose-phosphate synthase (UDP-forming) [Methylocystis echinoides]|uniref:Trehalose-6-phosphate synthase n=1 Tax=Methylocystis echinoides TaxID=29468 RepID=A0A9W6GYR7_9HYPH|nr:trehalose-6-phosphate synthase [Methylocystis echinoides]GLI95463.1 trehalose-6-phosphate synthase [Methylocystis echinoides]
MKKLHFNGEGRSIWGDRSEIRSVVARVARHPAARVLGIIALATIIFAAALAPLSSLIVEGWLRQDLDIRSRLIFRSVRDRLQSSQLGPDNDLTPYLERIAEDERLLALGYCSETGRLLYATSLMPKDVSCETIRQGTTTFDVSSVAGTRAQVASVALSSGTKSGHLLVVHDLSFIDERSGKAKFYTILALTGASLGLGLLAVGVVLTLMRGWARAIYSAIAGARGTGATPPRTAFPSDRDFEKLLNTLRVERKFTEGIYVEWSPATLHQLLREELPGAQVMIVSNREPYIHNLVEGKATLQIPASGLVAALEPVMRACGGVWIAHGSGSADRETVDSRDRIAVPPAQPDYTLRRVWLSDEEQDGYYYGFSNEGLWPLCHIAFVRPSFREADWGEYFAVNAKFAEIVVEEATCDDPVVLVQDYHFALLPRMIRNRLPKATIITFWHIPWPNSETFGICPWRNEIIEGLLGSTILGFHTQFHCNNFIDAADRFLESRIDRESGSITLGGRETLIRPYPISIEWPPSPLATQPPIDECRRRVRERLGLSSDARIGVGIERFDYTKGILDRMRAVDSLLSLHPGWRERFAFIQAAAPTRSKLSTYSSLQNEAARLADEINKRHGVRDWKPIHLVVRHHEQDEVYELFRAADICVVSSLHDGMNLVAKEFVAARDDELGVLILSSFAGASRELSEALIVNPYDTTSMATAIDRALHMSESEQRERMRLMRELVRQHNVYGWAAQMLIHAARLRKRERIMTEDPSTQRDGASFDFEKLFTEPLR